MAKRTAVLIHGCHLQADLAGKKWEGIVFDEQSDGSMSLAGRAVMGIKVAIEEGAERVIFSTGASERDGIKEGEYTYGYALTHAAQVAEAIHHPEHEIVEYLRRERELDLESQNTTEECERNLKRCNDWGIERLILVSSPWHIQRCYTEALKISEVMRKNGETVPQILALGSYGSTEGVVVLEPPHRGDCPKTSWHKLTARLFKIGPDLAREFEARFEQLLQRYGA